MHRPSEGAHPRLDDYNLMSERTFCFDCMQMKSLKIVTITIICYNCLNNIVHGYRKSILTKGGKRLHGISPNCRIFNIAASLHDIFNASKAL